MADLPLDAPVVGIGRSSLLPKPDTKNLTAYGGAEGEAAGQGGTNPSPDPNPSPSPSPNPNPNPNPLTLILTLILTLTLTLTKVGALAWRRLSGRGRRSCPTTRPR